MGLGYFHGKCYLVCHKDKLDIALAKYFDCLLKYKTSRCKECEKAFMCNLT